MYLPKSKYQVEFVSPGKFTKDGRPYAGPVLRTYLGETYAGTSPWDLKGKVEPIDSGKYKKVVAVAGRRIPTEQEYEKGSMTRYFKQNLSTMKVVELLPKDWGEQEKDCRYVTGSWILTGSLEDTVVDGKWKQQGVRKKNQETIGLLEQLVPGISSSQVLCDPTQFVRE